MSTEVYTEEQLTALVTRDSLIRAAADIPAPAARINQRPTADTKPRVDSLNDALSFCERIPRRDGMSRSTMPGKSARSR